MYLLDVPFPVIPDVHRVDTKAHAMYNRVYNELAEEVSTRAAGNYNHLFWLV